MCKTWAFLATFLFNSALSWSTPKPLLPEDCLNVILPEVGRSDSQNFSSDHIQQGRISQFFSISGHRDSYKEWLIGFANEQIPDFEDPLQEALFRMYVQFYLGTEYVFYKMRPKQYHVTRVIKALQTYGHLLPYRRNFARYQVRMPSGDLKMVRPLSFVEAPLRGCLGNDCSTSAYLDIAFHPNYHYFTLTDSQGHSNGQVTIVLGKAKDQKTLGEHSVAFVDKVQNIKEEELPFLLEAIRQSVLPSSYLLALPEDMGMREHMGLSIDEDIKSFIKNNIQVGQPSLIEFTPHQMPHPDLFFMSLPENTGFSRADKRLLSHPIEPLNTAPGVISHNGDMIQPWGTPISYLNMFAGWEYAPVFTSTITQLRGIIQNLYRRENVPSIPSTRRQTSINLNVFYDHLFSFFREDDPKTNFLLIDLLLHLPDTIKNQPMFKSLTLWTLRQVQEEDLLEVFEIMMFNRDLRAMSLVVHDLGIDINHLYHSPYHPQVTTAFHAALEIWSKAGFSLSDFKELIEHLIHLGGDINDKDIRGNTVLQSAIAKGVSIEGLTLLLDLKADVDAQNAVGNTPLHLAAIKGYPEAIDLLLSRGAKKDIKNDHYKTYLDFLN